MQNKDYINVLDNDESDTNKFEYNNAFSFDQEFQPDDDRADQLKNQYSTFIQQLEETTQKLMNQVFNSGSDYKNQIDLHDEFNATTKRAQNNAYEQKRFHRPSFSQKDTLSSYRNQITARHSEAQSYKSEKFAEFMVRNNKWRQKKQNFIKKQVEKKEILQKKELTFVPKILRGSVEPLQPIYERALQIHASKEKKIAYKKIEQKKKEEEQFTKLPFHPEINQKNKTRSLQQYLRDKEDWDKKKKEKRQNKRLKKQAEQIEGCSFAPSLISKPIQPTSSRLKLGQKVEDRLIRSLQKSFDQL